MWILSLLVHIHRLLQQLYFSFTVFILKIKCNQVTPFLLCLANPVDGTVSLQFYDKFNIRHNIAELLEYLWQVPSHRNAWRQVHHHLLLLSDDIIYLIC